MKLMIIIVYIDLLFTIDISWEDTSVSYYPSTSTAWFTEKATHWLAGQKIGLNCKQLLFVKHRALSLVTGFYCGLSRNWRIINNYLLIINYWIALYWENLYLVKTVLCLIVVLKVFMLWDFSGIGEYNYLVYKVWY